MREFKFRVWSIEEKQFISPNILEVFDESGDLTAFKYIKTGKLNPLYMPVENYIIQQYTGCHDSDNKEIYEGDIVQYNNGDVIRIGYIEFMSGIFFLNYNDETDEELGYLLVSNLKVIGNKFEHKELI